MEGEGRSLKGLIIERMKGAVSWVRFGEAVLRNLLKGIESYYKEEGTSRRFFSWKENGGYYKLENYQTQ